jgi:hypothetical protein
VLELRAAGYSVIEIAAALTAEACRYRRGPAGKSWTPKDCRGCRDATRVGLAPASLSLRG